MTRGNDKMTPRMWLFNHKDIITKQTIKRMMMMMMITDSGVFSPLASTGFLSVFHFLSVYIRPFCQSLWPLCHYRFFFGYELQIVRRILREPPSSAVRSRGAESRLQHLSSPRSWTHPNVLTASCKRQISRL